MTSSQSLSLDIAPAMFAKTSLCSACKRPVAARLLWSPQTPYLRASPALGLPRRRNFFSSKSFLAQNQVKENDGPLDNPDSQKQRRHSGRLPAAPTSLRRVAVEAQRSKDGILSKAQLKEQGIDQSKTVTAYAIAEQFNIRKVREILQEKGYEPDPLATGLYPHVVHVQIPIDSIRRVGNPSTTDLPSDEVGDVFVFPSGTVVAWSLPDRFTSFLATRTLLPAAEGAHVDNLETEDLEFVEDPQRENSSIKGDTIILGTRSGDHGPERPRANQQSVDTVLTKVAFSSGLARSTKLAVLESLLSNYFESTRTIPTLLSQGSRLPFTRDFVLRKTGQLLSFRAQLNLYSELTDSLPDLFWDSRHELGLEGYYEQVGRALDVGIRIKLLNEKMDYAQEIASVLRERLSETHGLRLEWIIILLIAVEVGFEVLRLWKERVHEEEEKVRKRSSEAENV
ncbi:Putative YagE family protein [Penicillium brasilianum]|uniref:Putative YagE family protein n=1 Tax=Penicillium brasilianum TaxID=104259 RepID=A0A0F7TLM7_PENBI|nr:Putative YagE family protein [Penicillium brasilianum]